MFPLVLVPIFFHANAIELFIKSCDFWIGTKSTQHDFDMIVYKSHTYRITTFHPNKSYSRRRINLLQN